MSKKYFPTLAVLGAYSGICLDGFSGIHEVFDHFYPGIMTLGVASMAKTGSKEILRQHPEISELPECTQKNWREYSRIALEKFGSTMGLEGPHGTGGPDVKEDA